MRQVLQSLKTGEIELVTAPAPMIRPRHVLIETRRTLISPGTERMLLEFGRGNLIEKALQQPDKVRQTLAKVRTDGLAATITAVRSKLDQPLPLGYCNAGVVREIGADVTHVKPGDRVVSNGPHAELAVVGRNLVARIPDGVSDEQAAFAPLAAIALQGCRLAAPALGETFCVIGLGLIGLLAVQLLRANGCRVIASDLAADRLALARSWGAETVDVSAGGDSIAAALALTNGVGVDGVIIAATSRTDDIVADAARMCRKRGRIVLVGVVGLNLSRADFYEKELTFQVSCSYGPGRHDPAYEVRGEDYPVGFVRWTEQRNFEAVLNEMAAGRLDVAPLISKVMDIGEASRAYDRVVAKGGDLGVVLAYPETDPAKHTRTVRLRPAPLAPSGAGVVALIGAGDFGRRITAPALEKAGARLKAIVSRGGVSSVIEGRKAGFEKASTDFRAALDDPEIDTVVIATRHDSHADLALEAIAAGKNVFVEKPLALKLEDVDAIAEALERQNRAGRPVRLMVGFNRRFSRLSIKFRDLLHTVPEPKCLVALINAGAIPSSHWTQDPVQGGGRIAGEACHFVDLMRFFVRAPIAAAHLTQIGRPAADGMASDKATMTLSFEDGSIATVHYFANGPKSLPKERFEALAGGRYLRLDNFKSLSGRGWRQNPGMRVAQDKGHEAALAAFIGSIREGAPAPIPLEETLETSRWSILAARQAAD